MKERDNMMNDIKKDAGKIRDSMNEFGNAFVSEKNKLENKIYTMILILNLIKTKWISII